MINNVDHAAGIHRAAAMLSRALVDLFINMINNARVTHNRTVNNVDEGLSSLLRMEYDVLLVRGVAIIQPKKLPCTGFVSGYLPRDQWYPEVR